MYDEIKRIVQSGPLFCVVYVNLLFEQRNSASSQPESIVVVSKASFYRAKQRLSLSLCTTPPPDYLNVCAHTERYRALASLTATCFCSSPAALVLLAAAERAAYVRW